MTPRRVQVLIGVGVLFAVLLVVSGVVLIVGWEDPVAAPASLPASTSSEPTSTTSASTTTTNTSPTTTSSTASTSTSTTSTSTTTTTLPPGACAGAGVGPLPGDATVEAEVWGDFDGDGAQDRFLVYEDSRGTHWTRVELSYGYAALGPAPASEFNVKRVNLGGPADLVAMDHVLVVGMSPPPRMASFYGLNGCDLQQVNMPGGEVAQLLVRGSSTDKAGVTCTASGIILTEAHRQSGGAWQALSVTYTWNPDAHRFEAPLGAAIVVLHSPEDDAEIESYADWDC